MRGNIASYEIIENQRKNIQSQIKMLVVYVVRGMGVS